MALEIENLRVLRGGRLVLDGVCARVPAGGILLLQGPNGAGKSTLLRAVAGLGPLAGGSVRLDGEEIGGVSGQASGRAADLVAWAGHLDAVKPPLTLAENLSAWAGLFGGEPRAALAAFGLSALADRPAAACSAGQKRRLGLARLLLAPRRLWLLDEPTVSLDAASAALLARLVVAHAATGGIAMIATHVDPGLPGAARLDLNPVSAGQREAADPFLAGDWA